MVWRDNIKVLGVKAKTAAFEDVKVPSSYTKMFRQQGQAQTALLSSLAQPAQKSHTPVVIAGLES